MATLTFRRGCFGLFQSCYFSLIAKFRISVKPTAVITTKVIINMCLFILVLYSTETYQLEMVHIYQFKRWMLNPKICHVPITVTLILNVETLKY